MSKKTIESWVSVLEASYIAYRLQPYFENFGKRVTKSPKIYFYDTGLVCYLLGIDTIEELQHHFAYGHLFENLVISEKLKEIWNKRTNERLYFWRDTHGNEVDLIIDRGLDKEIVEIKASRTYNSDMLKGIVKLSALMLPKYKVASSLVYKGDIEQTVKRISLMNWKNFIT